MGRFVQRDVVSRRRQVDSAKTELPPERVDVMEVDSIVDETAGGRSDDVVVSDDGHKKIVRRRKKRRRTSMRPYLLSAVWILLVVVSFVYLRGRMKTREETSVTVLTEEQRAENARRVEMEAYMEGHLDSCKKVLFGFWAAPDVAAATSP